MREPLTLIGSVPVAPRPGDVHVWRARLDEVSGAIEGLRDVLSVEERARVERLRLARDRERAILARGLLRIILGRCLGAHPARLCFTYGPHGKPVLSGAASLHFNVAHSGDLVLWAVAREHEVGIDVERIRPDLDWAPLATRFFAAHERTALRAVPAERRSEGFFACWTRKEAYLKATGLGLSLALDSFSVSVDPRAPAALLWVDGDPRTATQWSLVDIPVDPGYRACLAVPRLDAVPSKSPGLGRPCPRTAFMSTMREWAWHEGLDSPRRRFPPGDHLHAS